MIDRVRRAVRFEDVLLAAWLILVEPLLARIDPVVSAGPSVLDGVFGVIGLAGLAICLGARSAPGVISGLATGSEIAWAIGPLIGAFALVLDQTSANLRLDDDGPLVIAGLIALALLARFRLPALDGPRRRALVTPFILMSAGSFDSFLSGLRNMFDVRELIASFQAGGQDAGLDVGFGFVVVGLALAGILVFYLMLIFAPRQAAEREGSPKTWAIRFALFLASLVIGATWLGFIGG